MAKKKERKNRVWIGFDKPKDDAHGREIAEQGQAFLRKITGVDGLTLEWGVARQRYEFAWDPMSWETLADYGTWLNLTNLSK